MVCNYNHQSYNESDACVALKMRKVDSTELIASPAELYKLYQREG